MQPFPSPFIGWNHCWDLVHPSIIFLNYCDLWGWSFMLLFLQLEGQVSTIQGVVSQNNRSQDVLAIDWLLSLSLRVKRRLGKVGSNRIYVIPHEGMGRCGLLCGWPQLCFFTHPHISRPSDISTRTQTHTLECLENFVSSAFSPILSLEEMATRVGAGQMWLNIWIKCLLFSVPLSEILGRFAFSGMPRKLSNISSMLCVSGCTCHAFAGVCWYICTCVFLKVEHRG